MHYKKGDKVKHPKQEAWGIGLVLEDQRDDKVHILFEHAGQKLLSVQFCSPVKVEVDDSRLAMNQPLTARFLSLCPKGVADAKFIKNVTPYRDLSEQAQTELNEVDVRAWLKRGEADVIVARLVALLQSAPKGLIQSPASVIQAIEKGSAHEFASLWCDVVYGNEEERAEDWAAFAELCRELGIHQWSALTYLLALMKPMQLIIVMPKILTAIAPSYGMTLNFTDDFTLKDYEAALTLAAKLKSAAQAAGIELRDMMEVAVYAAFCVKAL
ncbi:DUF3553 domain-containing protein [Wohlfahrtiimonas sp. G9077]|uniref:DUF3553 domain-containing protein n=1 Tax=Wohlfahrtiimonas sp. G9077 TaxID=1980118 RepID=UPI000B98E0C9|nr:DUF3553 domain-containing protein [Wohlfahrtiimonas sp. G9077]OYQ75288.1 hypothetical protein B9T20_00915 [Wohlfahrtiimonas sp. G9077]